MAVNLMLSVLFQPDIDMLSNTAQASVSDTANPCSDRIYWVLKVENGKQYKRLYNNSTKKWLSDWIFVKYV